jgi:peroxiredoxin
MNKRIAISAASAALILLVGTTAADAQRRQRRDAPTAPSGPAVDAPAPNFSVQNAAGKTVNLSDYKGKVVVLEWWNYQCPIVKRHYDAGGMQKLQTEFTGKDVVWLSICSSAKGKQGYVAGKEATDVGKQVGMNATDILLDANGKVGKLYGARTTPHMYVIGKNGNLLYKGGIDDDPRGQGAKRLHVKEALDEVLAGKAVSVKTSRPYGCAVHY